MHLWCKRCTYERCGHKVMLKISILDTASRRRLVIEGKLIAPWDAELKSAWRRAAADPGRRDLVIDLRKLTFISEDGENVLLELMSEGANFQSSGVFTKWVLNRLARKIRRDVREAER